MGLSNLAHCAAVWSLQAAPFLESEDGEPITLTKEKAESFILDKGDPIQVQAVAVQSKGILPVPFHGIAPHCQQRRSNSLQKGWPCFSPNQRPSKCP